MRSGGKDSRNARALVGSHEQRTAERCVVEMRRQDVEHSRHGHSLASARKSTGYTWSAQHRLALLKGSTPWILKLYFCIRRRFTPTGTAIWFPGVPGRDCSVI